MRAFFYVDWWKVKKVSSFCPILACVDLKQQIYTLGETWLGVKIFCIQVIILQILRAATMANSLLVALATKS